MTPRRRGTPKVHSKVIIRSAGCEAFWHLVSGISTVTFVCFAVININFGLPPPKELERAGAHVPVHRDVGRDVRWMHDGLGLHRLERDAVRIGISS